MDAIIMAAGKGTRMRPLTDNTPKPLLEVNGKPILAWSLLALRPVVDRVLVVAHYLGEQVEAFMAQQTIFSDYEIVYQQPEPMGTGHALMACEPFLRADDFLIVNGDDLYHQQSIATLAGYSAGLLATWKDDPVKYGVVVRDEAGALLKVHEKPPAGLYAPPVLINIGAYKLNRGVFAYQPALSVRGEYELTDYIAFMAEQGGMQVVETETWLPIGNPDDLAAVRALDVAAMIGVSPVS